MAVMPGGEHNLQERKIIKDKARGNSIAGKREVFGAVLFGVRPSQQSSSDLFLLWFYSGPPSH